MIKSELEDIKHRAYEGEEVTLIDVLALLEERETLIEAARELMVGVEWGNLERDLSGVYCRLCRSSSIDARQIVHESDCPVSVLKRFTL